jgi:CRISPR-associated protein Cas2
MKQQFIVVVYDISNDRRRVKLHNLLKDFGTPVQYSVFECYLDTKRRMKMQQRVLKLIKPKVDHVRFYLLCESCLKRVEIPGDWEVLTEPPKALVV